MLAAIISKPQKNELYTLLPELTAWLRTRDYESVLDLGSANYVPGATGVERQELPR